MARPFRVNWGNKKRKEKYDELPIICLSYFPPSPSVLSITYLILNSDDHTNFLKRNGRNPADYRPDIVHQALLLILDSPLNKAGKVRAVYVRTKKGVLFEVKPHGRIPRTYKCFAGIMYAKGPGGVGQEAATLEIKEEMGKDGGRDGGDVSKATTAMLSDPTEIFDTKVSVVHNL
ncbi:uncharacterized protein LOC120294463 [Eucalyptus grandis]|uniref:uncharacterized protein LOC120294463 n=1 Tax=Eucalyptus grandis TaxID=71139 RepID=UPI00192EA4F9|nr:uncharacterized protein LOC120294463 [Eucalyptus grandis]